MQKPNEIYLQYVALTAPKSHEKKTLLYSFLVGGGICSVGQFFRTMLENLFGLHGDELAALVSVLLIFLGSLFTGLGLYDRLGKLAGGGSIVPITGFANSVVSPAMEFKSEGYIYGVAAKMFVIAGPIIVYGVLSSVVVGIVYFVIGLF